MKTSVAPNQPSGPGPRIGVAEGAFEVPDIDAHNAQVVALMLGERRDEAQFAVAVGGEDPVTGQFLTFLANDIANHPERVKVVDTGHVKRLRGLTRGVGVDLDAALSPDDE